MRPGLRHVAPGQRHPPLAGHRRREDRAVAQLLAEAPALRQQAVGGVRVPLPPCDLCQVVKGLGDAGAVLPLPVERQRAFVVSLRGLELIPILFEVAELVERSGDAVLIPHLLPDSQALPGEAHPSHRVAQFSVDLSRPLYSLRACCRGCLHLGQDQDLGQAVPTLPQVSLQPPEPPEGGPEPERYLVLCAGLRPCESGAQVLIRLPEPRLPHVLFRPRQQGRRLLGQSEIVMGMAPSPRFSLNFADLRRRILPHGLQQPIAQLPVSPFDHHPRLVHQLSQQIQDLLIADCRLRIAVFTRVIPQSAITADCFRRL